MVDELYVSIGCIITVVLFAISLVNFFSARKNNVAKNVENTVTVNLKLDEICRTTNDIRSDIKSVKNDIKDIQQEQIRQKLQIELLWKDVNFLKEQSERGNKDE